MYSVQLREEITAKGQEIDRESRRKAKLEKDLKAVQVRSTMWVNVQGFASSVCVGEKEEKA